MKHWITTSVALGLTSLLIGCATGTDPGMAKAKPAAAAATTKMAKKMATGCSTAITYASATDDGSNDGHGPENTIDGKMDNDSRWSSKSEGSAKALTLKLASAQKIGAVGIAWSKGDERKSTFSIETSTDGKAYKEVVASQQSGGATAGFEKYSFAPVDAQYVRILGNGNTKNKWNSIIEANAYGCAK